MAWHWQERFEHADVEGACRRQILKIQKPLPYEQWLKRKTCVNKNYSNQAIDLGTEDTNRHNEEENDAAFQDWLRQKRKQTRSAKKQQKESTTEKPWRKPPSMHVNPKTKCRTRKAKPVEPSMLKSSSASYFHECSSEENQQAYALWLSRIHQEDLIRRAQNGEELKRIEQQQREKHKTTWRKKLIVCAYSTLVVDS